MSKVLVVGLDGATFDWIAPWAAAGHLPHLARVMREGAWGPLRSTVPPVTAPAWISFMTGTGPAKHGTFHFRTFDLSKYTCYDETLVTSRAYAGTTIFDVASGAGRRVAAINVPMTYPPFPVNGVMVAGYPTPDAGRAYTYPPEVAPTFAPGSLGAGFFRSGPEERLRLAHEILEALTDSCVRLRRREPWDLFMVVYANPDMANHLFRRDMEADHPAHDPSRAARFGTAIRDQYAACDRALGALLETCDEDTTVIVMSDHGSARVATHYVNLNAWLRAHGWLRVRGGARVRVAELARRAIDRVRIGLPPRARDLLKQRLPARVKEGISAGRQHVASIAWSQTAAYRVPMAFHIDGINLNVRGRQPQGVVEPGAEYERLRDAIVAAARAMQDPHTGEPLVTEALRKEDVYTGERLDNAPDIVLHYAPDFAGSSAVEGPLVSPVPRYHIETWSGQHAMDGIAILWGAGVRHGARLEGARIVDLAPTILALMGLPVPEHADGRLLVEALEPEAAASLVVTRTRVAAHGRDGALDEEDEAQMREALRGLGYLS